MDLKIYGIWIVIVFTICPMNTNYHWIERFLSAEYNFLTFPHSAVALMPHEMLPLWLGTSGTACEENGGLQWEGRIGKNLC